MVWTTLRTNGTERGSIAYNGSGTTYNNTSDYRLKFDVKDIDENEAVERMKKLRTRTYRWKEFPEKLHRGFIAHELAEDNFQLCVVNKKDEVDKDGNPVYQGIDPRYMLADVCCCLKYTIKENEKLKERLNNIVSNESLENLKAENALLKNEMNNLKLQLSKINNILLNNNFI